MTLFHVSIADLAVGDVLEIGKFGAIFQAARTDAYAIGQINLVVMEVALESARMMLAQDKVSRLNCLFCCESIEAAKLFQGNFRSRIPSFIYEVEPTDENARYHRGNMHLQSFGPLVAGMAVMANRYWTVPPVDPVEVLCSSPARIIRRCA